MHPLVVVDLGDADVAVNFQCEVIYWYIFEVLPEISLYMSASMCTDINAVVASKFPKGFNFMKIKPSC